jgi:hypothetical protein
MITYENGMLVLNSALTKQDHQAVNQFMAATIEKERLRIYEELKKRSEHGYVNIALFQLKEITKL